MKTYYLVRHGASTADSGEMELHGGNAPATVEDIPLSEMGKKQAKRAGDFFRNLGGIDAVYSSPLERTHDTAKYIAEPLGFEVNLLPEFREVDLSGVLNFFKKGSGKMPVKFSPKDLPFDVYRNLMLGTSTFFFSVWRTGNLPNNERPEEVRERLEEGFRILDACPYENIVVSTHGFFLTFLATYLIGRDPRNLFGLHGRIVVPNCSVTKLTSTNGQIRLEYFARKDYDRML